MQTWPEIWYVQAFANAYCYISAVWEEQGWLCRIFRILLQLLRTRFQWLRSPLRDSLLNQSNWAAQLQTDRWHLPAGTELCSCLESTCNKKATNDLDTNNYVMWHVYRVVPLVSRLHAQKAWLRSTCSNIETPNSILEHEIEIEVIYYSTYINSRRFASAFEIMLVNSADRWLISAIRKALGLKTDGEELEDCEMIISS